jgi:hypothetical protein
MEYLKDRAYKHLTPEQVDHFMKHGFLRVPNAFSKEQAAAWTADVWHRLGMDPNDPSTWTRDRTNMPQHRKIEVKYFAPKAWNAIVELCGGEDRITESSNKWADSFIVNLGSPETAGSELHPKELDNWHVDGDFFIHFLDSPEQGLLVIPCWSDVVPNGGATWICDRGPKEIGQWLYDHPNGVTPWMRPVEELPEDLPEPPRSERLTHYINLIQEQPDESFHEMTGEIGDVILLHPLMLHSASKNGKRAARIITNPPIHLNAPFNFSRSNPADYSLVELKTIHDIGEEKLKNWAITGPRRGVTPERLKVQARWLEEENERLRKLGRKQAEEPVQAGDLESRRVGAAAPPVAVVGA